MWKLLVGVLVVMSPYVAQLRAAMGSAVLLLPSTSVLPVDTSGRLLLVQHRGHGDGWGTVGGAVEIGESPRQAALRETHEEIGALPRNLSLLDVLGGPDFEVTYPNGDRAAYVTSVFTADLGSQDPEPDGEEIEEIGWFSHEDLTDTRLNRFTRAVLGSVGLL
jgi:ADP-ribose pyrophosphatase YjhB (NUDIX family)